MASTFLPSRFFNTISIIPMVCGLWLINHFTQEMYLFAQRIRACGRMAFNSITQVLRHENV